MILNHIKLLQKKMTSQKLCHKNSEIAETVNAHVVLLQLLYSELGLDQVVVEDDDLPAQGPLLIVVVLGLPGEGRRRAWEGEA